MRIVSRGFLRFGIRHNLVAGAMLALAFGYADGQSTNIAIGPSILQPSVKRMGVNLSFEDFYDSGQMTKNLVFRNPGFESEIFNSTIRCALGTAVSCLDDDAFSGWPAGFWNNATYEIFYGNSQGRTGTVTGYTAANGTTGGTFTFSNSGVAPANGDYMIVRMKGPGNATAGRWPTSSGAGSVTTNTADLPPGTTGSQTAAVTAPTANDSANLSAYFDTTAGKTFVKLNGTYQLTFQAKGTGGSNSLRLFLSRGGVTNYLNQVVNLTNSWATYTFNFTAAENGFSPSAVALQFSTIGQDSFLIDNVNLTQTNTDPSNTTAFRDPVVNALKAFSPGVLRFWAGQLGDTLDNLIADPNSRMRAGYLAWYNEQDDISYGLHEFLQLCEVVGAEPWFVVPSTFSPTDASNLIQYLAGSSGTPYGAKRAARGQATPWTSVFTKIHLEFGNEAWNGTFKGGSIEYSAPYGQRAQTLFGAMRGNAAYIGSAFDLVLGGQAGWPGRNQDIQNNCNNNDSFGVAPYMMNTVDSFSDNESLYGSTFAEGEAYQSASGTSEGVANGLMLQNQLAIKGSNHPVPLSFYEMNLSTTQGSITQSALNSYASSVGAGLAVAETMLIQAGQGVITQNLFALPQYESKRPDGSTVFLWGAVVDMGVTDRRRPQFLALQLANQAIGNNGVMLQTVHTGANPTWNQPLVNTVQLNGAHYLQSFAFSNSSGNSVVVFNLHRTASLPVTFSGPNAPAGSVQMTVLTSANLMDTNETAQVVTPVSSTVNNFNPSNSLSLPPISMTVLTWGAGSSIPSLPTLPVITSVTATGITSNSATITWTTSQASSSQVEFGTNTAYGSLSALNSSMLTSHSVALSSLTPGTTYDFAVLSGNSAGTATSANFIFSTSAAPAPVITSVTASSITSTSATVTWTTDQPSTTQVEYGTTAAYGALPALNSTMVTSHSVSLTGLTPGTTYDYAALSKNSSGTLATSANFTFSTTVASAPVITSVTASSITTTSATITWTTDQASTTQVEYGTTTSYGAASAANTAMVASHSVALSGLTPGTTFNYAAMSKNAAGATATSANFVFSTTPAAAVVGSAISVTGNACAGWSYATSASNRAPGRPESPPRCRKFDPLFRLQLRSDHRV